MNQRIPITTTFVFKEKLNESPLQESDIKGCD